jgi:hypothetical protein
MTIDEIRALYEAFQASKPQPIMPEDLMLIGGPLGTDIYTVGPEGLPVLWVAGEAQARFFAATPEIVATLLALVGGKP